MFTPAPYVKGNGSAGYSRTIQARANVKNATFLDAMNARYTLNQSGSAPGPETIKGLCQKGVVAYKKYKPTSYTALYRNRSASGRHIVVFRDGPPFYQYVAQNYQLGLGYSGFNSTGLSDPLGVLDHAGTGTSIQALYNRAVVQNLKNRAISECRQKATQVKLDMAEALVGLPQSVIMVAQRASQLARAYLFFRKGNIQGALLILGIHRQQLSRTFSRKSRADAWLELQFGWLPLMSDIHDGMLLANELLSEPKVKQFYAKRRLEQELSVFPPAITSGPNIWKDLRTSAEGHCSVEVRYNFRVSNATIAFLNSLSLLNPLYVVWVAVPFSFVVDWLIPVGDWLQSLSSTLGLQFIDGYATCRSWGSAEASASGRTDISPTVILHEEGSTSASAGLSRITRDAYSAWPWPVPYVRFPFSSDRRLANAIALIDSTRKYR